MTKQVLLSTYNGTPPLLLIGPKGVGKSTIGNLIARTLQLPQFSLDRYCWDYYLEIDPMKDLYNQHYSPIKEDSLSLDTKQELWKRVKQKVIKQISDEPEQAAWKDFREFKETLELHAVRRVLENFPRGVIDFGAGHTIFREGELLRQMKKLLQDQPLVLLLLPAANMDQGLDILKENLRVQGREVPEKYLIHYLSSSSNNQLAKKIIYTQGNSVETTKDEVLKWLFTQLKPISQSFR